MKVQNAIPQKHLLEAEKIGKEAYKNGLECIPYNDPKIRVCILRSGYSSFIGCGEAFYKAWLEGYNKATVRSAA